MKEMKRNKILMVIMGLIIIFSSCEYEKIVDANYPDQLIYMPAAKRGFLMINEMPQETQANPTTGNPYKFEIDYENQKFKIPLSVYRAGINNQGEISVEITVNNDTIAILQAEGEIENLDILPSEKYSIDQSLTIAEGQESEIFNLVVDLNFLKTNAPDKKYALAINISSNQIKVNPDFSSTVVIIDTKILKPVANFTYNVDPDDWKNINFTNTSQYTTYAKWDFGDGSGTEESSPTHAYPDAGVYPVELKVAGLTGDTSSIKINVQIFDLENLINVVLNKPVKVSGTYADKYIGANAVDGVISNDSRWLSSNAGEHWIEIDLEQNYNIFSFKTWIGANGTFGYAIKNFIFQAEIEGEWVNVVEVNNNSDPQFEAMFQVVNTSKVRYFVPNYGDNMVRMYEIEVYGLP